MNEKEYTEPKDEKANAVALEINAEKKTESEQATENTTPEHEEPKVKKSSSQTLKDALKQVETIGQALGEALQGRGNVVMVRVNDEALEHLDMLVEAEITKSRSESAAFLINEGIAANSALFEKISVITQKITKLREQLRKEVQLTIEE